MKTVTTQVEWRKKRECGSHGGVDVDDSCLERVQALGMGFTTAAEPPTAELSSPAAAADEPPSNSLLNLFVVSLFAAPFFLPAPAAYFLLVADDFAFLLFLAGCQPGDVS